jgi:hypothetical protein
MNEAMLFPIEPIKAEYSNPNLRCEIEELELRYHFEDLTARYRHLVNFSTNFELPFHRWARYREGYSANLVSSIIQESGISAARHMVVDPMCGSGTTAVAANAMGFDAIGLDVNPFSIELASSKQVRLSKGEVESARRWLKKLSIVENSETGVSKPDVAKFFQEGRYDQLLAILNGIHTVRQESLRIILRMAWICILEDCSDRKKDGNGLATRPSPVKCVVKRFKDQASLMLEDLENPTPLNKATSSLQCTSAYDLKKAVASSGINKKVGLVVFSPPYANSFNYFESYKMELLAGGYCQTRNDIYEMSKNAVRSFRMVVRDSVQGGLPILDLLVEEIEAALPRKEAATGKRDGRTRIMLDVIKAYFLDMQKVIREVSSVLCESGRCYIVVDQSSYVGVVVPTDLLLARIGELEGFRVLGVQKCRKANTSGQQLREYPYLKHCLRESIVCLEKN